MVTEPERKTVVAMSGFDMSEIVMSLKARERKGKERKGKEEQNDLGEKKTNSFWHSLESRQSRNKEEYIQKQAQYFPTHLLQRERLDAAVVSRKSCSIIPSEVSRVESESVTQPEPSREDVRET
jgi:hypothetical protein